MASLPDIDSQRAYYDERWQRVTHANLWQAGRAIAVLDGLRRIGKDSPRMLDLGCGTGWLTAILAQFGPTTGVELSPLAIDRAREQHPDIEFLAGDFFTVPLPRGTFDVVVSCQVMEHVDAPQRFVDLVAELLKPDGHLLLVTDNWWNIARWEPGEFARFAGAPQPIQHRPSVREFRQLLRTRFTVQRVRSIVPGHGHGGILRLAHSHRLTRMLDRTGLLDTYHAALLRMGFGMLWCIQARRARGDVTAS